MKIIALLTLLVAVALTAVIEIIPEDLTNIAVNAKRSAAGLEKYSIQLDDGTEYVYLDSEPTAQPEKPVMVLLHGFGADKDNFTVVAPFLVDQYRLVIPDHQGFAESSKDIDGDYSPKAQAARLQKLFAKLGLTEFVLGGSSMGGQIALTYAALNSNQVNALWLLDPAGIQTGPMSEMVEIIVDTGINPLLVRTVSDYRSVFDFVMSQPPYVPGFMLDVKGQTRADNFELEQRIFNQIRAFDVTETIRDLPVPSLIVWGEEDRVLHPGAAEMLGAVIPKHQIIKMPGIGHLPMLEAPEQTAKDLKTFLATL